MDSGNWRELLETLDLSDEGRIGSSLQILLQLSLELHNREDVTEADTDRLSYILTALVPKGNIDSLLSERSQSAPVQSSELKEVNVSANAPCFDDIKLVVSKETGQNETLLNLLKLLRNLCAGVPSNQKYIVKDVNILPRTVLLCSHLLPVGDTTPTNPAGMLLKVALQLLGNSCASYPEGQERVWQLCYPRLLRHLLTTGSNDVIDMCSMVLHNCTTSNARLRSQLCSPHAESDDNAPSIIGLLFRCLATMEHLEWMVILLESLVGSVSLEQLWNCLVVEESREKLTLLRFVLSRVHYHPRYSSDDSDDVMELAARMTDSDVQSDASSSSDEKLVNEIINKRNLPFIESNYQLLVSQLLKSEAVVLNEAYTAESVNLDNSSIVMVQTAIALLRLLCRCAEVENLLSTLQQNKQLLDDSIALLRQLALLDGSESSGQHRSRLSSVKSTGNEPQHPTFGMKRDLVQLIGNMSFSSPSCQDRVREVNGIHLILNQCSIDHNNPLKYVEHINFKQQITQCAVWAIRNLCEGNPVNQAFIAELEQRGVDNAHALLEFGVEVEIGDDGKIKLKRTQKSTSQPHAQQ